MLSPSRKLRMGFLEKIGSALDRMSELAMLAQDETKNRPDRSFAITKSSKNWMISFQYALKDKHSTALVLFQCDDFIGNYSGDGTTIGQELITLDQGGLPTMRSLIRLSVHLLEQRPH